MIRGIGSFGDEDHDRFVRDLMERELFYRTQLTDPFRKMVKGWRLYMADRDDTRLPHEKWRAFGFVPYPYSGVETAVAVQQDIFLSTDPPIQAEGIGAEDDQLARKMEKTLAYVLTKNVWPFTLGMHLRELKIQGTAVWKVINVKRSNVVRMHPTPEDYAEFDKAIEMAVMKGAGNPPEDPEQFAVWRETVNTAQIYGTVPEPPSALPQEIIEYRGPHFERVSLFDTRFDPMVESIEEQPVFFHRIVKTRKWLEDRTGPEPWKPFDPAQVAAAMRLTPETRFSEFDEQISDMLSIPRGATDPIYKDSVELFEGWSRESRTVPYSVVLNRSAIINKTPDTLPFFHGKWPFHLDRNVPVPRRALGISDLQQGHALYHGMNLFRDLRQDALLLSVLGVFGKLKEMGLPEVQRFLRPGMILDLPRQDAIFPITKMQIPPEVWREEEALKNDIDETNATQPNVRGAASTIGRVSATEATGRLNQALQRQKSNALSLEGQMQGLPRQAVALIYQFMPAKVRRAIGGADTPGDPLSGYSRAELLELMDVDFMFRGATKAINRELNAQQLKDVMETGARLQALQPLEIRQFLTRILEILGQKGVSNLITKAGTDEMVAAAAAAKLEAARIAQQGRMPTPMVPAVGPGGNGAEGAAPPAEGAPPA